MLTNTGKRVQLLGDCLNGWVRVRYSPKFSVVRHYMDLIAETPAEHRAINAIDRVECERARRLARPVTGKEIARVMNVLERLARASRLVAYDVQSATMHTAWYAVRNGRGVQVNFNQPPGR
jgi:hypothetical protein